MAMTWRSTVGMVMTATLVVTLLSVACTEPEAAPARTSAGEPDGAPPTPAVTAAPPSTATTIPVTTPSPTPTPEPRATATPVPTPTRTPALAPTALPTQTPETTPIPTHTATPTRGPTPTPSPPSPLAKLEHGAWLDANEPALAAELKNLSWVADGVDENEREAAELLIASARQHPEVFAAVLTKPWVVDDVTPAETDAIYGLTRTPLFSEGLVQGLLEIPWAQENITPQQGKTIGYLYRAIRWAPAISDELLAYSWLEPAITHEEAVAVEYIYRAGRYAPDLAQKLVGKPWIQDGITPDEAVAVKYISRAGRYVPDLGEKLVGKPWIQDGITPDEAVAVKYISRAGRYVPDLGEKLVGKAWIQDGVTSQETSIIRDLYLISRAQDESLKLETNAAAVELADMPFLNSIERADAPAIESLRHLKRENMARFLEVMDHSVLIDGISDDEAKLVTLLWGTYRYKPEYVDDILTQTGIFVEEKTIQLPLSGEVLLAVFRHRDQATPAMDYLEHSATFMEDVMANPLPANYLAVFFTDALPEGVGGKHFGTYIGAQPHFDVVGTTRWKRTPFVIAHEVAHHYWSGNKWDWTDEGLAVFLATLAENRRTGFPVEARKRPCVSAQTIGELEAMYTEETGTEGDSCNYPLGEAIFLDLYHSLGEEVFVHGLRRLYTKELGDDPTDGCEGTQLRICHVMAAFKDGASKTVASMVDEVVMRRYGPLP